MEFVFTHRPDGDERDMAVLLDVRDDHAGPVPMTGVPPLYAKNISKAEFPACDVLSTNCISENWYGITAVPLCTAAHVPMNGV